MKLNKKQKKILYISVLSILLMALYSKKYILPEYKNLEYDNYTKVNSNQVKIY